jgi:hypothetical protein
MRAKLIILFTAALLLLGALTPGIAAAKGGNPNHPNHRGSCDPEDFLEFFECLYGFPN